jgi:formamidopyrimidine-DNA glycosylase
MPELAEVALYAHDLNRVIRGQTVSKISFPNQRDWGSTIIPRHIKEIFYHLKGKRIFFRSEGKALLLFSKISKVPLLEFRLGMTGQFHLERKGGHWKRHYFLTITFERGSVHYGDPRRFGRVLLPQGLAHRLGGYSESRGFSIEEVTAIPPGSLKKSKITWLLDSGDQTGVGNYMANEALGRLKLSPFTPCRNLKEAARVLTMCGEIAYESFHHGGNSFGSGYYRLTGEEGQYAKACRFYQNPNVPRVIFARRPVYTHFSL